MISKELEEAAEQKNLIELRSIVAGRAYSSPDFSRPDFLEALNYVKSCGIDIFQPFEGELVSAGKTDFTDEDFVDAVFELKQNFCQERINDVQKIGKAVYKSESSQPIQQAPIEKCESQKKVLRPQRTGLLRALRILFSRIGDLFRRSFSGQKKQ